MQQIHGAATPNEEQGLPIGGYEQKRKELDKQRRNEYNELVKKVLMCKCLLITWYRLHIYNCCGFATGTMLVIKLIWDFFFCMYFYTTSFYYTYV